MVRDIPGIPVRYRAEARRLRVETSNSEEWKPRGAVATADTGQRSSLCRLGPPLQIRTIASGTEVRRRAGGTPDLPKPSARRRAVGTGALQTSAARDDGTAYQIR